MMEKILAAMDAIHSHFFAGIHALNLAKRINAKVLFLLVLPLHKAKASPRGEDDVMDTVKKRSVALIEQAQSEGINVDYYLAHGDFEQELVHFIHENEVTLVIVENPVFSSNDKESARKFLYKLRHRINCRIEVVNQKTEVQHRKE